MADDHEARFRRHAEIMEGLARMLGAQHEFNRQPLEINADVTRIEPLIARMLPTGENGWEVCAGKERALMTEQNQARDLLTTLRDALQKLEFSLGRTREGVDEIASQAARLRAGVEALRELRQREDTSVGIEMFVDAAVDLLEAFRELEAGLLDVQADVDTLEEEMEDDGRDA
jgi:chromosome segregation ATPase